MKRFFQLISGIHRIHHIHYSYGWKIPFIKVGYFKNGWKKLNNQYHNCTKTNVY
jgi:hypothetical protein